MNDFLLEEQQVRVDLAAMFRLTHHFGWDDTIWNHITARAPGTEHNFFMHRFGHSYDEVCASNLIKVDEDGNVVEGPKDLNTAGFIIHSAIHHSRKDINCVMHTHSRAGLAISCLKEGLKPIIQDAAIFHNSVSYHNWEGMSTEVEECNSLSKNLGLNNVMILRNHGLLTCGKTISEAFMLMYYLDRACKNQIDTLSTGKETIVPSNKILEFASGQYEDPRFQLGKHEWPALLRLLDENKSVYKE